MAKHEKLAMLGERRRERHFMPDMDRNRLVLKAHERLAYDPRQLSLTGAAMKPEPDYAALDRQWENQSCSSLMRGENIMADKAKPKHERAGALSISVWENKGENGTYNTFSFQRSYKKDDKWENTESLRAHDLLPLAELLRKAYDKHVAVSKEEKE
jgi:hypothetical protein